MSNLTYEEREFQRQVRMCSGVGPERMVEILHDYWEDDSSWLVKEKGERDHYLRNRVRWISERVVRLADSKPGVCGLCGEPLPEGEEMFKFHGYSGPCPDKTRERGDEK